MMSLIFLLVFMIPLCFKKKYFYMIQFIYMFMFIMILMKFMLNNFYINISYNYSCDYISYFMLLLTLWIVILMMMASNKITIYKKMFLFIILLLLFSLFLTFCSLNVFIFYIFFEFSLIPTLFLILGWGYQPERIQAGIYMIVYTLLGALPMMISLFYMYNYMNSLDFTMLNLVDSYYMYLCMIFVFLIKFPMYFLHLWLPKAHVEAPISGSMILAGVMLKLGGYGFIRFMKFYLISGLKFNWIIMVISLFGGFIISLICLRQEDMKSLIAYSSVAHMSLALAGFMSMSVWGFSGAFIMMISHGLCSSGLFCLANISYERTHSRMMFMNKGLLNLMPSMSLFWFLLCSSNMAAPPSLNLFAEILLVNSIVSFSWLLMLFVLFISFFSGAYSLYLYSYTQHGGMNYGLFSFSLGNIREFLLLFLHWVPLNLIFLMMDLFI
uniref:NADH-ubiquinone oxidoreductase chain 4 n=1 Tax=Diaphanes pectinealis TaxID=370597 RepID=A0A5C0PWV3_9COLE|nr:NADH dehydrogenase subunit 4 [Diaphanes pectinealis]QEJ81664.1 NADH dehydrogenase subunit 4 [Diaphanes pectinealis]